VADDLMGRALPVGDALLDRLQPQPVRLGAGDRRVEDASLAVHQHDVADEDVGQTHVVKGTAAGGAAGGRPPG
jgi:hypothetical protein